VLVDELSIVDAASSLWQPLRPLLEIALSLDQQDASYSWHGWNKAQIDSFLQPLPEHCSLLLGVWDTFVSEQDKAEHETLVVGCVCEVRDGAICSIRTFEALSDIPAIAQLEPGFEHGLELMRAVKMQVAPVAWALFTDKHTWDEWLFAESDDGNIVDKGEVLAQFARQGRCVLMGSQARQHHHHL
jgi:hypothetical protein